MLLVEHTASTHPGTSRMLDRGQTRLTQRQTPTWRTSLDFRRASLGGARRRALLAAQAGVGPLSTKSSLEPRHLERVQSATRLKAGANDQTNSSTRAAEGYPGEGRRSSSRPRGESSAVGRSLPGNCAATLQFTPGRACVTLCQELRAHVWAGYSRTRSSFPPTCRPAECGDR